MLTQGADTFVEIGPREVLTGLIKRISSDAHLIPLSDVEIAKLLVALGVKTPATEEVDRL
jgi:[acyl-carrier-protein] S-malonyltransferase